jgi:hypothetical protein
MQKIAQDSKFMWRLEGAIIEENEILTGTILQTLL